MLFEATIVVLAVCIAYYLYDRLRRRRRPVVRTEPRRPAVASVDSVRAALNTVAPATGAGADTMSIKPQWHRCDPSIVSCEYPYLCLPVNVNFDGSVTNRCVSKTNAKFLCERQSTRHRWDPHALVCELT